MAVGEIKKQKQNYMEALEPNPNEKTELQNPITDKLKDFASKLKESADKEEQDANNSTMSETLISQSVNSLIYTKKVEDAWNLIKEKLNGDESMRIYEEMGINPFFEDINRISNETQISVEKIDKNLILKTTGASGYYNPLSGKTAIALPSEDLRTMAKEILSGSANGNFDTSHEEILKRLMETGSFGDLISSGVHEVLHRWQNPAHGKNLLSKAVSAIKTRNNNTLDEALSWNLSGKELFLKEIKMQMANDPEKFNTQNPEEIMFDFLSQTYKEDKEEFKAAFDFVERIEAIGEIIEIKTGEKFLGIKQIAEHIGENRSKFDKNKKVFPDMEKLMEKYKSEYDISNEDIETAKNIVKDQKRINISKIKKIANESVGKVLEKEISASVEELIKQELDLGKEVKVENVRIDPKNGVDYQMSGSYAPMICSPCKQTQLLEEDNCESKENIDRCDNLRIKAASAIGKFIKDENKMSKLDIYKIIKEALLGLEPFNFEPYEARFIDTDPLNKESTSSDRNLKYGNLSIAYSTGCHTLKMQKIGENNVGQVIINNENIDTNIPDSIKEELRKLDYKNNLLISIRKIIEKLAMELNNSKG